MRINTLGHRLMVALPALLLAAVVSAQSVNPTVEVTRKYEGTMGAVHKSYLKLTEADSSMYSQMDFSYSVFDRRYGKSYDFTPHRFGLAPAIEEVEQPWAIIKAQGGYPFSSSLSFWGGIPQKGGFSLDVYGDHSGYYGNLDKLVYDRDGRSVKSGIRYGVNDADYKAGVRAGYGWKSGRLYLDLCYDGLSFSDTSYRRNLNSFTAAAGIERISNKDSYLHYDVDLRYSRSSDNASVQGVTNEDYVGAYIAVGPVLGRYHKVMMQFGADYAAYSGYRNLITGVFDFVPSYSFQRGRWSFGLGVKFSRSYVSEPGAGVGAAAPSGDRKTQLIFPEMSVSYNIIQKYLSVYAKADGGNRINRYSDFVRRWHSLWAYGEYGSFQNFTVDPYRLRLGFSGSAYSRLSFDLSAVYGRTSGAPSFSAIDGMPALLGFGLDYDYLGTDIRMDWKSQDVEVFADILYRHYFNVNSAPNVFVPASFEANMSVRYNWNRRFYATASARFMSDMKSVQYSVPGWVDFGLSFDYVLDSDWTLVLSGTNLFNQAVQLYPGMAVPGVKIMAGFCLKL